MIWFPELFYRFEEFEREHPGQSASVCEVSSVNLENENGLVLFANENGCLHPAKKQRLASTWSRSVHVL